MFAEINWFVTIPAYVLIIAIPIIIHEFGHFLSAKLAGVRVSTFGVGFPPRIFSIKKGDTTYSLNLLPFGGYCRIHDDEDDPTSLFWVPKKNRLLISLSGIFMNLLLAAILLALYVIITKPEIPTWQAPIVGIKLTWHILILSMGVIYGMVGGNFESMSGIVQLVQITASGATYAFNNDKWQLFLLLASVISISIAAFNLIPFPGLDGGRLLFLLFETVLGYRSIKLEAVLTLGGFACLVLFGAFMIYHDLTSPLPHMDWSFIK